MTDLFFRAGFFSSLPEVRTERLLLRRLVTGDAKDMHEVGGDPMVSRYVMWHTHTSLSETREYLRSIQRSYRLDRPAPWGIELTGDRKVIGTIGYIWINADHRTAEIGYSLGQMHWNKGYATEALTAALSFGFSELGLNRIEAQHDVRNPASGKVMQKAGMCLEGRLRERLVSKGEFITVDLYAALGSEWPPRC